MNHKSIPEASHTFFSYEEERFIREKFKAAWDANLPISGSDILAWVMECVFKYNKHKSFKGGRKWLQGFCNRSQISIQVKLY